MGLRMGWGPGGDNEIIYSTKSCENSIYKTLNGISIDIYIESGMVTGYRP